MESPDQLGNLGATRVQLSSAVTRTPDAIIARYRENRNWKLYPKEWIYHNLPLTGDVLDFGCGTGEITTQLALLGAKKVYAMDVTPGLLEVTKQRAELDGVVDRVEIICDFIQNVEPRPCDLVIAFAALHHCHPLKGIIPHLLNWVKPGGTFVCVEPIVYFEGLERARVASGVPFEPLDEGERKLDSSDIQYICDSLEDPQVVHFRLLGRADRWLPDGPLRRIDSLLLNIPGMSRFAGTALIHGKKR
jgi:SAM-dependent methyltransferase